ncbi:unnamed protein product [Meloidogyne enterolobii]|uniref:Uncharacterized protein n=1 Tax=Meloidogyne enterolobii TaxID=390850 RepID=A0ACB0YD86_MELEN
MYIRFKMMKMRWLDVSEFFPIICLQKFNQIPAISKLKYKIFGGFLHKLK